ncbi:HdeD family acid-resistance protein [Marivita sp. GX14005]|uniref:HdeD family acid-resistance protein n=1 Tax=Marivita sp. GX14005 TaxID=2942276 RepID=UPI002018940F|nr:HdeD family acid-resistance protein [Marivita sp. GX14005]MCL3882942.1 HdeD family acid-resistance protein [Marivita sp. GX14005]
MEPILQRMQRNWWIFLLRGIAAILLGLAAFFWPALTMAVLVVMLGAYVLVDGVFGLIDTVRYRERFKRIWPLVLESILGIVFGLLTLLMPGVTAFVLLMFIAAWAVIGGVLRIVLAFQIRHEITGEWLLILGGVLSILFGGLLIAMPVAGLISVTWLIGLYAVLFGVLFVILAFRLKGMDPDETATV